MESENCYFTREFEIEGFKTPLTLIQKEVGDVSCVVWDAALVLAKYLERNVSKPERNDWLKGKNILELGAGLGCVGLTAASFGGKVVMTDLADVIPLLQKNIDKNKDLVTSRGGTATAKTLEWGTDLSDWAKPDILILADCVYYSESIEPLVKTMQFLTHENTEVLLCQEERISDKQIQVWKDFQVLLMHYFEVSRIPQSEQHERFCSPDICILRLKKKTASHEES